MTDCGACCGGRPAPAALLLWQRGRLLPGGLPHEVADGGPCVGSLLQAPQLAVCSCGGGALATRVVVGLGGLKGLRRRPPVVRDGPAVPSLASFEQAAALWWCMLHKAGVHVNGMLPPMWLRGAKIGACSWRPVMAPRCRVCWQQRSYSCDV